VLESGKFRTRRFIESSLEHGEHEQQVQREDNAAFNTESRQWKCAWRAAEERSTTISTTLRVVLMLLTRVELGAQQKRRAASERLGSTGSVKAAEATEEQQ
jgi:hypothetical protein